MQFGIFYELQIPRPWETHSGHKLLNDALAQVELADRLGKGMGAFGFQFVSADAAHDWGHAYYNAITKRLDKLGDYQINPNTALVSCF